MLSWMIRQTRNQKGFTLIELLVVVAIIALLTAFAVPRLFEAITSAKKSPGQADLATISDALERYYFDENFYPKVSDVATQLKDGGPKKAVSYLKSNVDFKNGFDRGYLYQSDASGSFYLLGDPGSAKTGTTVVLV